METTYGRCRSQTQSKINQSNSPNQIEEFISWKIKFDIFFTFLGTFFGLWRAEEGGERREAVYGGADLDVVVVVLPQYPLVLDTSRHDLTYCDTVILGTQTQKETFDFFFVFE